jgi:predicted glycogen debranching enzyme
VINVEFGRDVCGNLEAAESREWLVTNGIGGYASGTIAGGMTRRYHGVLVAALQPPVGRTLLVAGLDEVARCAGAEFSLATHRWASGAIAPKGFHSIESFRLEGVTPVWVYAIGEARLEKRVWMEHGANTTYVRYALLSGSAPIELELKALVNYRDFHSSTHAGDWRMQIEAAARGIKVLAFEGATPFYLRSAGADCVPQHEWYRDFFFPAERERGLDDHEDQLYAAGFRGRLVAGEQLTMVFSTEERADLDGEVAWRRWSARQAKTMEAWDGAHRQSGRVGAAAVDDGPAWLAQLVLAADQFIVKRALPDMPDGQSVIAGYHWFGDWGRDTMIALPGLTLATGRPEVARQILLAFAKYVDGGMLPNNFPDSGSEPGYNTVDAGLWYFEAVRQYFAATRDFQTLQKLFPVLAGMMDAHVAGTRYQIHVDASDGLLFAGEPGVQLTWMDAKVGDWVVTPRTGKAVEINALWINALETMTRFAAILKVSGDPYRRLRINACDGFRKFWNVSRQCCFDVIDAPEMGNDASLRPNQIFAVSLPFSPLTREQQKAVVDICAAQLLTPSGLRSLAPGEHAYQGQYRGGPRERDGAYHQGTVWAWLTGAFALAHYRVYGDRAVAMRFLEPLGAGVHEYGLGTLGEIFDGDAPFTPKGCIAQAWSVGEALRVWTELAGRAQSPAISKDAAASS